MTLRVLPVLALALMVGGCANLAWERPATTPEVAAQDEAACRQAALLQAQRDAWADRMMHPYDFVIDPRGRWVPVWRPVFPDPGDTFFREQELTRFCMRNKGYRLVPSPP